jgi:hypothetical protein
MECFFIADGSPDTRDGVRTDDSRRESEGEVRPPEDAGQPAQGRPSRELPHLCGWPQRRCPGELGGYAPPGEHSSGRDGGSFGGEDESGPGSEDDLGESRPAAQDFLGGGQGRRGHRPSHLQPGADVCRDGRRGDETAGEDAKGDPKVFQTLHV